MSMYKALVSTSKAELRALILQLKSISAVCRHFGMKTVDGRSRAYIRNFADSEGLNEILGSFTELKRTKHVERIADAVKQSLCINDVLRQLDLPLHGNNHVTVQKIIADYNIDISHFNIAVARVRNKRTYSLEEIFCVNSTYSRSALSGAVRRSGVLEYCCAVCGNKGEWMGKSLALVIDHINGINNDNRVDNLRYMCHNCHSQTPTFAGKNS